ncbi:hypothetical protein BDV96DRAFT_615772 [Lophiotrema nucula]|uniref:Kinase-like domain-containing protein n=1 Tax=Lophiotrema nucula TaxID=690887 RepID=A0A6A5YQX6_9PLEO|nr:hypothetical protein BDV96DRAFT_615772 [Lophiotrema nucula]
MPSPYCPATQQVLDPRRLGRNNSGLTDNDIADVLVVLHPTSPSAIKVVEATALRRPEHVLFQQPYDSFEDLQDIEEQETIIMNPERHVKSSSTGGNDLALRMSSALHKPGLGFVFGRNPSVADIVFAQDAGKRISNQHFRIYLNSDAILMLEDMSTNGTLVDDVLLKSKDARFTSVRMLASGSIICVSPASEADLIKFIVRIPSRHSSRVDRFQRNLHAFFTKCLEDETKLKAALRHIGERQYGVQSMRWDGGEQYNNIGMIGKGAFATVYQLATKMDGKLLAAKELEKRRFMKNGQLDKKIDNEMRIMQDLKHPNIVEFVGYHDQGDFLYIIMEYVRHGDLAGYLNHHGCMKETDARLMAQQMLSALSYLHRMKITHRDIKPDNILIANLDPLEVKLSDFGLSKVVKADETFLKTFCGTLLYCAPEVFPDFDDRLSKGTKRRRGAKQQYNSYSSSVDIWSFAGVIWYALCGKPPFEGIADQTGQAMYNNIMSSRLDPTPLREKLVSEAGIDLLCKMLQKDPALRPTEVQCLNHPWLKDGAIIPDDSILQSIVEEDEVEEADAEQQLSQLSLHEDFVPESDDEDVLEDDEFGALVGVRQSKKIKPDPRFPRNQLRDSVDDSSAEASFHSQHQFESGVQSGESFNVLPQQPKQPRLFGEIGQSALQSSGLLDVHANEALSNDGSSDALPSQKVRATSQNARRTPPYRAQVDGAFSSPSLLGAESMVRELNMASPQSHESQGSVGHSENEPATPTTPDVPQHNSLERHSQNSEPTPKANQSRFNRQISLPKTASFYYNPYDESTHNLEYASKVSGFDFVKAADVMKTNKTGLDDTIRQSAESADQQSTANNSNNSRIDTVIPLPAELNIKPPPRRLGKLTATADSFAPGLTLMIDQSRTSWGRLPGNTIVYEKGRDTRVPKTAFIIFWWSSAGEDSETISQLSSQGKDWTSMPGLRCGIFTCATAGISVNGKLLRRLDEKGRALFGHLHHGDVISVYQSAKAAECLKFKVELYLGLGKEPRPAGKAFKVLIGGELPGRDSS